MGKCIARGDIPYVEINVCDGCIHKDVCGDKDYLTENRCSGKVQGDIEHIVELMKAEEQGMLVRLPCKRGDKVWRICGPKKRKFVAERTVLSVTMYEPGVFEVFTNCFDWLGKTVFLTRKEAEKALKETNRNG